MEGESLKSVKGRQRNVGGGGSKWDILKDLGNGVAGEIDGSRKRKEEQKQQRGSSQSGKLSSFPKIPTKFQIMFSKIY